MIEFSCVYCGRPMRAEEELRHRQVLCPACGHLSVASGRKPGDRLRPDPPLDEKKITDALHWADKSDDEVAECLLPQTMTMGQQQKRAARMAFSPLRPRYDDLTLFALSLSFTLLGFINVDLRRDLVAAFKTMLTQDLDELIVLPILAAVGMALSLALVFLRREKSDSERSAMLVFAVLVTGGTGLYAGWIVLQQSKGWLMMIFPIWNIIHAGLLLVLYYLDVVDSTCVTDEHASFAQVVLTAICVPVLLVACQYFQLHWAVTFSIAAAYTMSLHNALRDVFGGRRPADMDVGR